MSEHPFAEFLRILGKGRHGSRDLSRDEAYRAMTMILRDEVEPLQLGAFLMLLRVKDETVDEFVGMLEAARASLPEPPGLQVDLDWPAYAGKRKHLPWFLLAAKVLAARGVRIVLHTAEVAGRMQVHDLVAMLDLPWAQSWQELPEQLARHHWACIDLREIHPGLAQIVHMRALLGVRSPMHSLVRLLNPAAASAMLVPIFHPAYREKHRAVLQALATPCAAVFKGEGGEAERNPDALLRISGTRAGQAWELESPAMFAQRHEPAGTLDPAHLLRVWKGEQTDAYGEAAVCGTLAIALYTLGRVADLPTAQAEADLWWQQRHH